MSAAADPAARPSRWVHTLLLVVIAAMALDIAVGLGVWLATSRNTLLPVLATFLALSGIRLVGIAIDTVQRTRARAAAGEREPLAHGYGWAAYRLAAAIVALACASYLLFAPAARRLSFFADDGASQQPVEAEPARSPF